MRLKDYPEKKNGKRVWLDEDEVQLWLDEARGPLQKVAFLLAARVGLRRGEIVQVRPVDFVEGPTGSHVRVWEDMTKAEAYREPPVPEELANIVETLAYEQDPEEPVVDRVDDRVYQWTRQAAERCRAKTNDEGWKFLGPHDLRRTWGVQLLERGVVPSICMEWGGWEDWETFRDHYLGEFSPQAIKRERAKVNYLRMRDQDPIDASAHAFSGGQPPGSRARNQSAE